MKKLKLPLFLINVFLVTLCGIKTAHSLLAQNNPDRFKVEVVSLEKKKEAKVGNKQDIKKRTVKKVEKTPSKYLQTAFLRQYQAKVNKPKSVKVVSVKKPTKKIIKRKIVKKQIVNLIKNAVIKHKKIAPIQLGTNKFEEINNEELIKMGKVAVKVANIPNWTQAFKEIAIEKNEVNTNGLADLRIHELGSQKAMQLNQAIAATYLNTQKQIKEQNDRLKLESGSIEPMVAASTQVPIRVYQPKKIEVTREKKIEDILAEEGDLVAFDYSKNQPPAQILNKNEIKAAAPKQDAVALRQSSIVLNSPGQYISSKVKNVIKRVMRKKGEKSERVARRNREKNNRAPGDYGDYSQLVDKISENSTLDVKAIELSPTEGFQDHLVEFEVRSAYDYQEPTFDESTGMVSIDLNLSSDQNVMRSEVFKSGFLPTTVDFVLDDSQMSYNIPLIEIKKFDKYLDNKKLQGYGSFLLIERSEEVKAIGLDKNFEDVLFFDGNFKEVAKEDEAYFVFYMGMEPGNVLISYRLENGELATKITHTEEAKVHFEISEFTANGVEKFKLYERNLLGLSANPMDVEGSLISLLATDKYASKESLHNYRMTGGFTAIGARRYYKFDHLSESIFLGKMKHQSLEVPSQSFIRKILDEYSLSDLEYSCMIQLNLKSNPMSVRYAGQKDGRDMALEVKYLNKQGNFDAEMNHQITNMFLMGEGQGIIHLRIDYQDHTSEILQTFCSPQTYLVEQF